MGSWGLPDAWIEVTSVCPSGLVLASGRPTTESERQREHSGHIVLSGVGGDFGFELLSLGCFHSDGNIQDSVGHTGQNF